MAIKQQTGTLAPVDAKPAIRLRWRRVAGMLLAYLLVFGWIGGSSIPAQMQESRSIDAVTQGWEWDVVGWELDAIGNKIATQIDAPVGALSATQREAVVADYMSRAHSIAELQDQINAIYADPALTVTASLPHLVSQVAVKRADQRLVRRSAEQVIEQQIGQELHKQGFGVAGMTFPPVLFTFSEAPRKLIVSPRDRIETAYYAMLKPDLPADQRENIEQDIYKDNDLSAYVTSIGGLGAYPTLVIDRAPLDWVLSTVAHEWTHNYLTLFPLGLNYGVTPELTIINETVADIVGNEVGDHALRTYYPALVREFPGKDESAPAPGLHGGQGEFDFDKEMRQTRETVDLFLKYGRIRDAEEYMEVRRLLFVENGYPIRKLNQAYFAFHGNYGTGAAATSPIGPKLEQLRAAVPDLHTFLETVRWFTSEADLDGALAKWG